MLMLEREYMDPNTGQIIKKLSKIEFQKGNKDLIKKMRKEISQLNVQLKSRKDLLTNFFYLIVVITVLLLFYFGINGITPSCFSFLLFDNSDSFIDNREFQIQIEDLKHKIDEKDQKIIELTNEHGRISEQYFKEKLFKERMQNQIEDLIKDKILYNEEEIEKKITFLKNEIN